MAPLLVLVGVLGLVVGSFLNVVIHRLPRAESLLRPGSRCPHCATPIRPWHNVPVFGWLVLRGRCVACQARISPRYPLVEAVTALLFLAVTVRLGLTPALPAFLYLTAVAGALAPVAFQGRPPPRAVGLPAP